MANILKFYEGGITYRDVYGFTFSELLRWEKFASRINREIEKATKK